MCIYIYTVSTLRWGNINQETSQGDPWGLLEPQSLLIKTRSFANPQSLCKRRGMHRGSVSSIANGMPMVCQW